MNELTVRIHRELWPRLLAKLRRLGCKWRCVSAARRLLLPSAWLIGKLYTLVTRREESRKARISRSQPIDYRSWSSASSGVSIAANTRLSREY